METMHAAGRRSHPPVPRATTGRPTPQSDHPEPQGRDPESPTERFVPTLVSACTYVSERARLAAAR